MSIKLFQTTVSTRLYNDPIVNKHEINAKHAKLKAICVSVVLLYRFVIKIAYLHTQSLKSLFF